MEYRSLEREMFGFVFVRGRREGDILNRDQMSTELKGRSRFQ